MHLDPHTTALLQATRDGDAQAADALLDHVYDELRSLAQARLGRESGPVTLSATGLVHEAYIKLVGKDEWADRAHFMAVSARAMRQILIDRARARNAVRRGGKSRPETLHDDRIVADDQTAHRLLDIDRALDMLAIQQPDLARLVELRFFGGMTMDEVGQVLGVSSRTVSRQWIRAKAYLALLLD